MLNKIYPPVYNKSPITKEILWNIQGYVLFARLKNHTVVFTKVRKVRMDMLNNVKFADLKKIGNITRKIQESALTNMRDGLNAIQKKFTKIKELITKGIRKGFWRKCVNQEKPMDMQIQKPTEKEIVKKLNAIIMSVLRSNFGISLSPSIVKDVKTNVCHKLIIKIIQSLWKLFGFVENVMVKSIEYPYQRERLNLWTPKGDAIVQTTEETCRGEFEAIPPPRNWSVSFPWLKVIAWLRHTAGCSFYQGQCIKCLSVNDLGNKVVHLKSLVIGLEGYGESYADKAQAGQIALAA